MGKMAKNKEREERIYRDIIVDAYDEDERAMGWYSYLEGKIAFPFKARVIKNIKKSPLQKDEIVSVTGMTGLDEDNGMYVQIEWNGREFGVPLEQLYPVYSKGESDKDTIEAIEDWHYWKDS